MRKNELSKIKKRDIKDKYSDFELEALCEEIKEYKTLLTNIGIKIKGKQVRFKKKRIFTEEHN
jgi:hypothetical protein